MTQYNRIVDDLGKGLQSLRRMRGTAVLANGTIRIVMDVVPAKHVIRRVIVGSAVATDITGDCDVLALASGSDLDAAPGASNQVIAPIAAFADKKMNAQALTSFGKGVMPADTTYVLSVAHNAAVVGGEVHCVVEYDLVAPSYGAYDAGGTSRGTYD